MGVVSAEIATSGPAMRARRSKYGAVRCEVDGIKFASQAEARRYQELRLLEKAGEVFNLLMQVKFPLEVVGCCYPPTQVIGNYVADFVYFTNKSLTRRVVEDVKGFRTPMYRWKKKHVEAQYGIEIVEL